MSEPTEIPIAFATGTEAQHLAAEGNYAQGQVSITTGDSRRMRCGLADGSTFLLGWPKAEEAIVVNPAAGGYSANQTFVVTSGHAFHTVVVTPAVHVGAYTHKLILPATESSAVAVLDGTFFEVLIAWPASTHPTLEVRNETAGGTLLWSYTDGTAIATKLMARFHRTGGAWVHWGTIFFS